ncbi:hypothetical protein DFH08DRAFT_1001303 [Mycena albidolilacea]|uniref:Uncharacterized protein n=1 Tax=Mycena albidolilacea TaxID=1033008 RepID=A0AAD7A1Z7_9AGAR|nr:hypothetical protein DFH08DRAFT_1001303 [Mycena albidolilacea]
MLRTHHQGPKLLCALQKAFGIASLTTVQKTKKIPRLLPSIGVPTLEEINSNIENFLAPEIKPPPTPNANGKLPGNILMFDGVSLESKCRYCPEEHSYRVKTKVESFDSIEQVRVALFEPETEEEKVCLAADATVVAIASYAQTDHYTPVPIVLSPSDNTEKGKELAAWMKTVLEAYRKHPFGAALHGDIWALASDGAAPYRWAKHELCMTHELNPLSPLGKILRPLCRLNCFTSEHLVLATGDPKHFQK